jgi:hypothetical protein
LAVVPAYDIKGELAANGYSRVYAVRDIDAAEAGRVKAGGEVMYEQVIEGEMHFCLRSVIEVDCDDGTVEWAPVLFRYRVRKQ